MVRVELPEDGEDALVGEEHLPDGLDPAGGGVGVEGVGAELLGQHDLPGVQLEDGEHVVFVGVKEGLLGVVPADLVHVHLEGAEAGLLGGVAEVDERELVFGVVEAGEVDGFRERGGRTLPGAWPPMGRA